VFEDGGGPALYVGGIFTSAGGSPAYGIARWDGSGWSAVGGGLGGLAPFVRALVVHDDGSGAALYAGGTFTTAAGLSARRIARWNGSGWSTLGNGMNDAVSALTVFDDGGGPVLYSGGSFSVAGDEGVGRIAKWDGSVWAGLATGMHDEILALSAFDDGSGPALYAGGAFTTAGGAAANRIARWNGSSWSALGSGVGVVQDSTVNALAVLDEGNRQTLYVGGNFGGTIDSGESFLATWSGCLDSVAPELECPSALFVRDARGSPPGEIVHFSVTATDNLDSSPTIVCDPPSGSLFPRGTTLVDCTATDATGNQSTCQFSVIVTMKSRRH